MKATILVSLLLVGPVWLSGCEYYAAEQIPVMSEVEQGTAVEGQGSQDEAVLPQTDSVQDGTAQDIKILQDLKGQYNDLNSQLSDMTQENETLRAELEKERQDLEKRIADLQDELEKAQANDKETPKPESGTEKPRVLRPRAEQLAQIPDLSVPVEEEISKLVLGEAETELDRVGGDGAAGSVEKDAFSVTMEGAACAINKIIAHSDTVVDRLSFFFEEPDNIAKDVKGFYDRQVAIGGGGGSVTSIVPPARYVFTAFVAYVCPRPKGWDISDLGAKPASNDGVICGFRPIAKRMDASGLSEDPESLWFGPAIGTASITTGDLFGPKITHSIGSGEAFIKMIIASGQSFFQPIDGKNAFFYETCPAGQALAGFRGEGGQVVDRLTGVCKPVVLSE